MPKEVDSRLEQSAGNKNSYVILFVVLLVPNHLMHHHMNCIWVMYEFKQMYLWQYGFSLIEGGFHVQLCFLNFNPYLGK